MIGSVEGEENDDGGCRGSEVTMKFVVPQLPSLPPSLPTYLPTYPSTHSSQQALHFAAQAVMSGTQDIVIAGGVESMTRVPMGSNMPKTLGMPNDDSIKARYNTPAPAFSQFIGAEMMGVKYDIGREEMDSFAARSHMRAAAATEAGRFLDEITAVPGLDKEGGEVRGATASEGKGSESWK